MSNDHVSTLSDYVTMRDGVRLALTRWFTLAEGETAQALPVVLITTRYWRAMGSLLGTGSIEQKIFYPLIIDLLKHQLLPVIVDARGTGASFGHRTAEVDKEEIADITELIRWLGRQEWCNGDVVTAGTSYSGITTLYSLLGPENILRAGVCRAPDFDMYRHLFAPGGVVNRWFVEAWGGCTADLDANDIEAVRRGGYFPLPEAEQGQITGVKPVDGDNSGRLLAQAIASHQGNFNIADPAIDLAYIDNFISEKNPPVYSREIQEKIEEKKTPVTILCGWHDAGTQLGALSMFASFSSPVKVVIGPWNHDGTFHVDPFNSKFDKSSCEASAAQARTVMINTIQQSLGCDKHDDNQQTSHVEYYTLGEDCWHKTERWPLPTEVRQTLYFNTGHQLTDYSPTEKHGSDTYLVDYSATTGVFNRWYAQASQQPILFTDRCDEDEKLLTYDSLPLSADIEITGHPLVNVFLSTDQSDAYFFVYLEVIDPQGKVTLLTEGQIRGQHCTPSHSPPPYKMFGPYYSLLKADAQLLVPNKVIQIKLALFPISILIKKGMRIRVAISGADKDTFNRLPAIDETRFTVERNAEYLSFIELPVIPKEQSR